MGQGVIILCISPAPRRLVDHKDGNVRIIIEEGKDQTKKGRHSRQLCAQRVLREQFRPLIINNARHMTTPGKSSMWRRSEMV